MYSSAIAQAFESGSRIYLPASVLAEAGIVADQRNRADEFDALLGMLKAEIVPIDGRIADAARKAFRKFGRGHHKARLNFADCLSYATARALHSPLLYKGNDFRQTDIEPAIR